MRVKLAAVDMLKHMSGRDEVTHFTRSHVITRCFKSGRRLRNQNDRPPRTESWNPSVSEGHKYAEFFEVQF